MVVLPDAGQAAVDVALRRIVGTAAGLPILVEHIVHMHHLLLLQVVEQGNHRVAFAHRIALLLRRERAACDQPLCREKQAKVSRLGLAN